MTILSALFRYALAVAAKIVLAVVGLVVVALALPFRTESGMPCVFSDPRFTHLGQWRLCRLPRWALWWDNPFDGLYGDARGWWANQCLEAGRAYDSWASCWLWAAIRNPVNYFSRQVIGVDVAECTIARLAGADYVEADQGAPGWQVLLATRADGKTFPRFLLELPWRFAPSHILLIDLGWKVKLSHNGTFKDAAPEQRIKGVVCAISLWKEL